AGSKDERQFFSSLPATVVSQKFAKSMRCPYRHAGENRQGGFTFEVQQVTAENLCRGFVVKTLSGSVIIGTHQGEQALIGQRGQISFPRQSSAHASDGVFNAALLPRCMRVAEKGAHR